MNVAPSILVGDLDDGIQPRALEYVEMPNRVASVQPARTEDRCKRKVPSAHILQTLTGKEQYVVDVLREEMRESDVQFLIPRRRMINRTSREGAGPDCGLYVKEYPLFPGLIFAIMDGYRVDIQRARDVSEVPFLRYLKPENPLMESELSPILAMLGPDGVIPISTYIRTRCQYMIIDGPFQGIQFSPGAFRARQYRAFVSWPSNSVTRRLWVAVVPERSDRNLVRDGAAISLTRTCQAAPWAA